METENSIKWHVLSVTMVGTIVLFLGFAWMSIRYKKNYWHHGVRLPYRPDRLHWYVVTLSVGCRPWAGHEGDIYITLVGSAGVGRTFLINGEVHSRVYEAEAHMYLYSSPHKLGEISYVVVFCGASPRKKRWHLSSIQVKYLSSFGREKFWYFPYHEWIEVFLEPVKVTLCGVSPNHDLNRRLLLGWLSRGVSDFHLWISMFGPLKYTRFRRAERFLCSGSHVVISVAACTYLNGWVVDLGYVMLGIYASAFVAVPIYFCEWIFRITQRHPKVVIEDINWYKDDRMGIIHVPRIYQRYNYRTPEDCNLGIITCAKFEEDYERRIQSYRAYPGIMQHESVFWEWLSAGANEVDDGIGIPGVDPFQGYRKDKMTVPYRVWNAIKSLWEDFSDSSSQKDSTEIEPTEDTIQQSTAPSLKSSLLQLSTPPETTDDPSTAASVAGTTTTIVTKKERQSIVLNPKNFSVDPRSLWRVDSNFSIFSMNLQNTDLTDFTLLESMPVADFDALRQGRRPLLGWSKFDGRPSKNSGMHVYRRLVEKVTEIKLPESIRDLTKDESQLVSMIFYDLVTKTYQWSKPGVPEAAYLTEEMDKDIVPATDWIRVDIASKQDINDWNPIDFKGRKYSDIKPRFTVQQLRHEYPEPIPRQRVFSMLMFGEYCRKLGDAYAEMVTDPEMNSCLAELFSMIAESGDATKLFSESCLLVATSASGRETLSHLFSAARKSVAWTELICDITQRLRFQGDNVKRIKEKYGLKAKCKITKNDEKNEADYGVRCFESDCSYGVNPPLFGAEEVQAACEKKKCVYSELDRMMTWSQKLADLKVPKRDCPLGQLAPQDLTRLSRFYRSMIKSQDGGLLFAELLIQCLNSGKEKGELLRRVLRTVISQPDGVERLVAFHRELGDSGGVGQRLLIRMYNAVKAQPPHGFRVLRRLADFLSEVPMGKMMIEDLQVDGKKAHAIARRVKHDIYRHLYPYVETISRYMRHVFVSMNELAKCLLVVSDHARNVLEGNGEFPFKPYPPPHSADSSEDLDEAATMYKTKEPEPYWKSKQTCCRNYKELVKKLNEEHRKNAPVKPKEPPPPPPDSFKWTPKSSALSCGFDDYIPRNNVLLSDLWQPVDARTKIDIYSATGKNKIDSFEQVKRVKYPVTKPGETPYDCKGFKPPCCKRLDYCLATERSLYNRFYLQSSTYESFYMNFNYRRNGYHRRMNEIKGALGGIGAQAIQSDIDVERHYIEDVARKWGRKVVYEEGDEDEEDPEKKLYLCICKHGKALYSCLICSIARQIAEAKTSDEALDAISDQCRDAPRYSTTQLQPFPKLEHITIPRPQTPREVKLKEFAMQQFKDNLSKPKTLTPAPQRETVSRSTILSKLKSPSLFDEVRQSLKADKKFSTNEKAGKVSRVSQNQATSDEDGLSRYSSQGPQSEIQDNPRPSAFSVFSRTLGRLVADDVPLSHEATVKPGKTQLERVSSISTDSQEASSRITSSNYNSSEKRQFEPSPSSSNSDTISETSPDYGASPFPSTGCCLHLNEPPCPCNPEPTEEEKLRTKRNLAMYTKVEADYPDPDPTTRAQLDGTCPSDRDIKLIKVKTRYKPITAKNPLQLGELYADQIKPVVKEALKLRDKKPKSKEKKPKQLISNRAAYETAGMDQWAKESNSDSDFSQPRGADDPHEYCVVCGGVTSIRKGPDPIFVYRYLVKANKGERQLDRSTIASLWSWLASSDTDMKYRGAKRCCKTPGCPNILPADGFRFYDPGKDGKCVISKNLKNKLCKIEDDDIFQQWLSPEHALINAAHKDTIDMTDDELDSVITGSYATSPSRISGSRKTVVQPTLSSVPITTKGKFMKKNLEKLLNETCELHKLPRFACCRLHDEKWTEMKEDKNRDPNRLYPSAPYQCKCSPKEFRRPPETVKESFFSDHHSMCSECRIRIGTQQLPPCSRYILPLKAVRCYEEALKKYTGLEASETDSGVSLDTAGDVVHHDDKEPVNPVQQQTLMDLMGITKAKKAKQRPCSEAPSRASSCISLASTPSTEVCCHVEKARRIPLLHLQGYGCDPIIEYPDDISLMQRLPLSWWRKHDIAIRSAQECVDVCVRFRILIARKKSDATSEHEKTCKVCGPPKPPATLEEAALMAEEFDTYGGMGCTVVGARFSEMLPNLWQASVKEEGNKEESQNQDPYRVRFYRQLVRAIVESTRVLILTPDLMPPNVVSQTTLDIVMSNTPDIGMSNNEAKNTSVHMARLAQFRAMMKAMNVLLTRVNKLKQAKAVTPADVNQASGIPLNDEIVENSLETCTIYEKDFSGEAPKTFADSFIRFVRDKMGGTVEDCREVLGYPWEFPIREQHVAGRFLVGLIDQLQNVQSRNLDEAEPVTLDDSIEAALQEFISDAIFRATTQTNIQLAVKNANRAKQYLAYLECIARLCAAKVVRYGEVVDKAILNTRRAVKKCLEAVEENAKEREFKEEWWRETEREGNADALLHSHVSSVLRTGRDDSRSTLDDVLIGFERLRRHVRYDLTLANQEILSIESLMSEVAMTLYSGLEKKDLEEKKSAMSVDPWTESEQVIREKYDTERREERIEKQEASVLANYLSPESYSGSDSEESDDKKKQSEIVRGIFQRPSYLAEKKSTSNKDSRSMKRFASDRTSRPRDRDTSVRRSRFPYFRDSSAKRSRSPYHRSTSARRSRSPYGRDTSIRRSQNPNFRDTSIRRSQNPHYRDSSTRRSHSPHVKEDIIQDMIHTSDAIHSMANASRGSSSKGHLGGYSASSANSSGKGSIQRAPTWNLYGSPTSRNSSRESSRSRSNKSIRFSDKYYKHEPRIIQEQLIQPKTEITYNAKPKETVRSKSHVYFQNETFNRPKSRQSRSMPNSPKFRDHKIAPSLGGMIYKTVVQRDGSERIIRKETTSSIGNLRGSRSRNSSPRLSNRSSRDPSPHPSNRSSRNPSSPRPSNRSYRGASSPHPSAAVQNLKSPQLLYQLSDDDVFYSDAISSDPMSFVTCSSEHSISESEISDVFPDPGSISDAADNVSIEIDSIGDQSPPPDIISLSPTTSDDSFQPNNGIQNNSSSEVVSVEESAVELASIPRSVSRCGSPMESFNPYHGIMVPSAGRNTTFAGQDGSEEHADRLRLVPLKQKRHRFGSVFAQRTRERKMEGHTRKALQTNKGKNMLEEIFGRTKTPQELMEAYHLNIKSLIRMQSGGWLPHITSNVMHVLLFAMCGVAIAYCYHMVYFVGLDDDVLHWAIPISILTFGLILEPIKCLFISWILFLRGMKPPFYNSPLFIKTNATLMRRASALRPIARGRINRKDMTYYNNENLSLEGIEEGLFRQYVENKSRAECESHQRRRIPAVGDSDVSLELDHVTPYAELEGAPSVTIKIHDDLNDEDLDLLTDAKHGHRRAGLDKGAEGTTLGFRKNAFDVGGRKIKRKKDSEENSDDFPMFPSPSAPSKPSILRQSSKPSAPDGSKPHTRIVWCNYATDEDGRPSGS